MTCSVGATVALSPRGGSATATPTTCQIRSGSALGTLSTYRDSRCEASCTTPGGFRRPKDCRAGLCPRACRWHERLPRRLSRAEVSAGVSVAACTEPCRRSVGQFYRSLLPVYTSTIGGCRLASSSDALVLCQSWIDRLGWQLYCHPGGRRHGAAVQLPPQRKSFGVEFRCPSSGGVLS